MKRGMTILQVVLGVGLMGLATLSFSQAETLIYSDAGLFNGAVSTGTFSSYSSYTENFSSASGLYYNPANYSGSLLVDSSNDTTFSNGTLSFTLSAVSASNELSISPDATFEAWNLEGNAGLKPYSFADLTLIDFSAMSVYAFGSDLLLTYFDDQNSTYYLQTDFAITVDVQLEGEIDPQTYTIDGDVSGLYFFGITSDSRILSVRVSDQNNDSNGLSQVVRNVTVAAAVPEPSTWLLMGLGATMLVASQYRRKS